MSALPVACSLTAATVQTMLDPTAGNRLRPMRWNSLGVGSAALLVAVVAAGCTATGGAQEAVSQGGTSSLATAAPAPDPSPPLPAIPAPTPPPPKERIIPIPPWRPNVPTAAPPTLRPLQPSPRTVPCGSPLPWPGACVVPVSPAP